VTAPNEFFCEMRADEAGAAGDQVMSHGVLPYQYPRQTWERGTGPPKRFARRRGGRERGLGSSGSGTLRRRDTIALESG
jgi:hypothetical protein